jgi:hypothetical protein
VSITVSCLGGSGLNLIPDTDHTDRELLRYSSVSVGSSLNVPQVVSHPVLVFIYEKQKHFITRQTFIPGGLNMTTEHWWNKTAKENQVLREIPVLEPLKHKPQKGWAGFELEPSI